MRAARCVLVVLCLAFLAAPALAQAPGFVFRGWAPLGQYEQAALDQGGALRMTIPTRSGEVEVGFVPSELRAPGYAVEEIDARGMRRGGLPPRFTAYTGTLDKKRPRDFAKLAIQPGVGRVAGLARVDGVFYALDADLGKGDLLLTVRELDRAEIAGLLSACGVEADELLLSDTAGPAPAPSPASAPATAPASGLREIELGTEEDALFVSQTGGAAAANARALAIVNMINGIYETDLGLTNRVVVQRTHTASDPYTTTDAGGLLDEFRSEFAANVATAYDDALLFSGRNFDGSIVGIAWVDATCTPFRYGVNQYLNQDAYLTSLIAAHELGHNLGAVHSTDGGLMSPSINPAVDYFSASSKAQIASYVNGSGGGCLSLATAPSQNVAPVLAPIGPQMVAEGSELSIQLNATDANDDALTYSANPLPAGATLSAGGLFRWTPSPLAAGCGGTRNYSVLFRAVDPGGAAASESVTISVTDLPTNSSPVLVDPADRSLETGDLLQSQLQAVDADGDTVTYTSPNLPAGASISPTGLLTWTPTATQVGSYDVTLQATDCTNRTSAAQTLHIAVAAKPAPHLTSLSAETGWVGQVVTLSGADLLGNQVVVRFAGVAGTIQSLSDTAISVKVPKVGKKKRKAGAQPVTLTRDGVSADNVLSFDYVKP
jgi:hypothetical protein